MTNRPVSREADQPELSVYQRALLAVDEAEAALERLEKSCSASESHVRASLAPIEDLT